jgi:antitoxin PrlF
MPIASAKVTSKGQITLPAELRQQLGIKPGDRVDFERTKDGRIELVAKTHRFEDLRGILPYDGPPLTDEDIVEIVRQARTEIGERVYQQVVGSKRK